MENVKNTACLEITSTAAKLAVGYVLSGQPVLLYYIAKPLHDCVENGDIIDPKTIQNVISGFLSLEDEEARLKISVANLSLILPTLGFKVYQSNKITNVIATNGMIDKIDISNAMSLVKKEPIAPSEEIVDIVPDCFALDSGKIYANPPLNETSNSLTVYAKIHTLPAKRVYDYKSTVEKAGFRIVRCCVGAYCASQLLLSDKTMPDSYLYVDMGARLTTVSIIGRGAPIASAQFYSGGDYLTEAIAQNFAIPFQDAQKLKENNGYDQRQTTFQTPLIVSKDEDGKSVSYYQRDLNAIIENFYESYDQLLSNAISTLIAHEPVQSKEALLSLPLILGGGASQLYGLEKLIWTCLGKRKLIRYVPHVLGARDASTNNLLGLIMAEGSYKGTLEDDYHGVSTLSRG
jgi:cell division protein FtsA